ncbi:hypothetical protein BD309DRAFT_860323 [Dichomitus squalens]|uniref:Uncharacterized protein n=1 Tax=Dichomitus squalens TaxID=114155 RepID=A0A4Q9NWF3_9APHY|nr:hypothetical protein BD309DRAFT_860323 [Dichomitus squalens]TBU60227.1 hypothetical protein BD310DRAFT_815601 [Dichomitus squalens]
MVVVTSMVVVLLSAAATAWPATAQETERSSPLALAVAIGKQSIEAVMAIVVPSTTLVRLAPTSWIPDGPAIRIPGMTGLVLAVLVKDPLAVPGASDHEMTSSAPVPSTPRKLAETAWSGDAPGMTRETTAGAATTSACMSTLVSGTNAEGTHESY